MQTNKLNIQDIIKIINEMFSKYLIDYAIEEKIISLINTYKNCLIDYKVDDAHFKDINQLDILLTFKKPYLYSSINKKCSLLFRFVIYTDSVFMNMSVSGFDKDENCILSYSYIPTIEDLQRFINKNICTKTLNALLLYLNSLKNILSLENKKKTKINEFIENIITKNITRYHIAVSTSLNNTVKITAHETFNDIITNKPIGVRIYDAEIKTTD